MIRSPLVEEPDRRSPDFVWEAEYQDKMPVLKNSIAQVPSTERRQMSFQFIDDMKATFDLKSMHSKRKRPVVKPPPAETKPAARKDRKGQVKAAPDNTKKRRPRNAFILYRTVLQAKAEFKGKTQTELSRLIAACWQNEPPETRAYFERAAELEKAFGYGATDIFNIKVGPADKADWDVEPEVEKHQITSEPDDENPPLAPGEPSDFSPPVYPMYYAPFDQPQPDPYQVQASYQMATTYPDTPVFAGTPCGQINLSPHPQQQVFPFNNYSLDSTQDQSGPMTPRDYGKSPSTFYASAMEHSASNLTSGESYTLHTTAPEISDIAGYSPFDYEVHYGQTTGQADVEQVSSGYPTSMPSQDSFHAYNTAISDMYNQQSYPDPNHHQSLTSSIASPSTSEPRMYMQPQYPTNDQSGIEGYLGGLGGQIFNENEESYHSHNVNQYQ